MANYIGVEFPMRHFHRKLIFSFSHAVCNCCIDTEHSMQRDKILIIQVHFFQTIFCFCFLCFFPCSLLPENLSRKLTCWYCIRFSLQVFTQVVETHTVRHHKYIFALLDKQIPWNLKNRDLGNLHGRVLSVRYI